MKIDELKKLFEKEKTNELAWTGECHDCGNEIEVVARMDEHEIGIEGGVVYNPEINGHKEFIIKCDDCYRRDPVLRGWQPVECYSRIVGYLRPTSNWNGAKRSEFGMRKTFEQPRA